MGLNVQGRMPTVPEYYKAFIDPKVDLTESPKQCCPFHKEDTPSFSYDFRTGRWSCFGACHAHGDVVDMHMRWYKFKDRNSAEQDLARKCNVNIAEQPIQMKEDVLVNEKKVDRDTLYLLCCNLANSPERYCELDEIMSVYPVTEDSLYNLYIKWSSQR